ncbi:glycoside hydrolase family 65 protein [Vallitalea pronyensis]|uniref:Glycoside hydrolase family 65 protein n=1 Tax=Vallitalea pronyensis TaxID=1348613 RepID=A0A8J8SGT5_9FIRM|nr:glycoside hydrolase family 65 protein [Vallitalea pronyensis]QUI22724.1 glycoside hydrolase family 65 protein [Vallitalea pronyensis]
MKEYFKIDEWLIIEDGFDPDYNRVAESAMSLGNGHMGMRGNFEETYSGDSLRGTYYAGIYYPDKTKVGWWKNGYPEWFAKVLNGTNVLGIGVHINGLELDLATCEVYDFKRVLNMQHGYLERSFIAVDKNNHKTQVSSKRFLSMADSEIGAIAYSVKPLNYTGTIKLTPYLDGKVVNEDSNYDEFFWEEVEKKVDDNSCYLTMGTKKLGFQLSCAMTYDILINGQRSACQYGTQSKDNYVGYVIEKVVGKDETLTLLKYFSAVSNRDYDNEKLAMKAVEAVNRAHTSGYEKLFDAHVATWEEKWHKNDITITGDAEAQQGIRFNIFHLNQTYTGEDQRLNIGPKGFTGEKYGGSTYWDTEAYCLPFYLSTAPSHIARNLLIYRYNHLEKAKENAARLGLKGALYPMVTMNGEECHNEWEITFEEIHRNGAIAYAIYNYINYTGDKGYLAEYGIDVLVEISRFWADRVTYNPRKEQYMILGVTGPNEYENNVNNNWYTNTIASWTMEYTQEALAYLKEEHPETCEDAIKRLALKDEEIKKWQDIIQKMYYPIIEDEGVFAQQDGYMDKEQILVEELDKRHLPLNQKWSWDRILRSCFIKQADVLQGIYFFNERYDLETIKRNFDFYEPRTVHESSLSPCIYGIIASQLGYEEKAYGLYLRTARLDLDNYNHDTEDGLHITSMAGTWMSVVHGFGGLKVVNNTLHLAPFLPQLWKKYSFRVVFRDCLIKVTVDDRVTICLEDGEALSIMVYDQHIEVTRDQAITL